MCDFICFSCPFCRFRHALMTWGEKYTAQEVDDAFDQFEMDDRGFIETNSVITLLTGKSEMDDTEAAA